MKSDLIKEFPFLTRHHQLVYFDNAATTHKPQMVLDAINSFYVNYNANIYRGIYSSAETATQLYEDARTIVASFIGAQREEIIFTAGTTAGINFVAQTWGSSHIKAGDEILITQLEHHANILPWQRVAQITGARLVWYPVQSDGTLDMNLLPQLVTPKTKLIAVTAISNAIGTHVDIQQFAHAARSVGAKLLVDAAQLVAHRPMDVQRLGADFLVFSGHKLFGPTGVGVLYINKELHDQVSPYQVGGGMVFEVLEQHATWLKAPYKFEAGTPPIAQAIGLGAAIKYFITTISWQNLERHEAALCRILIDGLSQNSKIRILGPIEELKNQGHLVSFVVEGVHAHDVAAYLDSHNIAVRAGHHCAQPLARALGYSASVRASFALYNTVQEVDLVLEALEQL